MEETTAAAAAAAAATAISFPEDVVREILVRVEDEADLFRCALTCTRWRRLVAKASFLRRRWPEPHASSFLSGFFTAKRLALTDPAATVSLVPTPGSMAVLNLLAGTCEVIPLHKGASKTWAIGCAILTATDWPSDGKQAAHGHSATFFKLLIINTTDVFHRPWTIQTFTSGEASWNTVCEFSFDDPEIGTLMHLTAVVCRGKAHWLVRHVCLQTLDVDVETCKVSQTEIPVPILYRKGYAVPRLSIDDVGGALSLLHLRRPGLMVDIWTQQQDHQETGGHAGDDARWVCRILELQLPTHNIQSEAETMYLSFLGEKGGMLLLKDNHRHFYAVDLKTGVMRELMDCGRISSAKVVPFEMDWQTFFVSRLGSK
uniref:Uncharacterized protein n=1 Tax=Avena sativa TaxID=4498 RepID=A0ACD6AF54_AVESA